MHVVNGASFLKGKVGIRETRVNFCCVLQFLIRKVFNSAAQPGLLALTHRPDMPASLYERLTKHELDAKARSDYLVKLTNSRSLISEVAAAALAAPSTSASERTDTDLDFDFDGDGDHDWFASWSRSPSVSHASASDVREVRQKNATRKSKSRRSRSRPPPASSKSGGVAGDTEGAALSKFTVSFEDAHSR